MIHPNLHQKPIGLDREKHRGLRLDTAHRDMARFETMNSMFVACAEFADACKENPLVWVRAGESAAGKPQVAPVAVFGLQPGQNLCIDAGQWRVRYLPVLLRLFPFALARVSEDQVVLCIDESWGGFSAESGEALIGADGEPSAYVATLRQQLEQVEIEVERTRLVGDLLLAKNLLADMRFEATLPDGKTLSVNGFLTVDEKRLQELPDADVLELHRNGVLGLIHLHRMSLGHMRRLVEWHAQRIGLA